MVALRRKVVATVDDSIAEASVDVTAVLKDGRRVQLFVKDAIGSMHKPLSDAALDRKFHDLVDPVLGAARGAEIVALCRTTASAPNLRALATLSQEG